MDALKNTINEMKDMFNTRMSEFEEELQKTPSTTPTASTAADFAKFRSFVIQSLEALQQQVELLTRSVDHLEMQGRRKILLLHGVPEDNKEDTPKLIVDVVKARLNLTDFKVSDIKRCHRMGRTSTPQKPRPILFKLFDVEIRDSIWFSKTKLKGSGITVSEFLTKVRHDLFMAAREKFGVSRCWTKAGAVFVLGFDGSRQQISSLADMNKIVQPIATLVSKPAAVEQSSAPSTARPKRAAALKK